MLHIILPVTRTGYRLHLYSPSLESSSSVTHLQLNDCNRDLPLTTFVVQIKIEKGKLSRLLNRRRAAISINVKASLGTERLPPSCGAAPAQYASFEYYRALSSTLGVSWALFSIPAVPAATPESSPHSRAPQLPRAPPARAACALPRRASSRSP